MEEQRQQERKQDLVMKRKKLTHPPPPTEEQTGNKGIGKYKYKHKHYHIVVSHSSCQPELLEVCHISVPGNICMFSNLHFIIVKTAVVCYNLNSNSITGNI